MLLPRLSEYSASRSMVDAFRGYNHNPRIGDGEFYEMQNMTSDLCPVLAPRNKRGLFMTIPGIQGMISKEQICYVDGSAFVIGTEAYDLGLAQTGAKQLVSMGAYVIILPDKKYINTMEPEDRGDIEAAVTTTGTAAVTMSTMDGEALEGATAGDTAPQNPENGDYWIDTSAQPHVLKRWAQSTAQWVTILTTYVRIGAAGIGVGFEKQDGVTISGIQGADSLNGSFVIQSRGDDYIVIQGILDKTLSQTESIRVSRTMPEVDFVVESENRLWGCRYGLNAQGKQVNEIYASRLGDFRNWESFQGISTDSYAVSVGSDGPFTGAATHQGYPLFFKETCLHKVYGNQPSNYQVQTTACRGVQRGSYKSLATVNEVLYYKARSAVMAYDGSLPTEISGALGDVLYRDAVAGAHGDKYYISMADSSGVWNHFVYDTKKGIWCREDDLHVTAYCSHGGEMYAVDDKSNVLTLIGPGSSPIDFRWSVETGEIGLETPDMKYINRILIRMQLDVGSELRAYARYDFSEEWEPLFALRSTNLRSFDVPIRPVRCDFMKLRLEGDGPAKIYSITKTMIDGSGRS